MDNIVLIGFMGCGKSTVGKQLADSLKMGFIDMDDEIEKNEGETIQNIFQEKGESYFRDIETSYLSKMIIKKEMVIATGGGVIIRGENIDMLKKMGKVIFLHTDSSQLVNNLKEDSKRPLLNGGNTQDKISSLLDEREPKYLSASDIIIQTTGKDVESVVQEIISLL
jgi:shikimate kinase